MIADASYEEACTRITLYNDTALYDHGHDNVIVAGAMVNMTSVNASRDPGSNDGPSMLTRFLMETVIALPLSTLGIVGNILAVIVLLRQRPRLTTSILLVALAIADCLVLLLTILLRSLRYIYYYTLHLHSYQQSYHYVFLTLYPSAYFIRLVDTWLIVLLTIDRFIVVCHPLQANGSCTISKTRRNIVFLILLSALFSLPRYFEHQLDFSNPFKFSQTVLTADKTYTVIYRVVLYLIVMYLCPMFILVVLNSKLLAALRKAEKQRITLSRSSFNHVHNHSITAIVVIVVAVSILSNTVALLSHLLWSLQLCFKHLSYLEMPRRYTSLISNILITINSAGNFLIYVFCSKSFRNILVRTCGCKRHQEAYDSVNGSVIRLGTYRTHLSNGGSERRNKNPIDQPLITNKPNPEFV